MVDSRLGNFGPEYDNIDIHSFCDYASASSELGGSDVPYCNYGGESVVLNDELNCNNKYCPRYQFLKTTKDVSTFHGLRNTLDSYKLSRRVDGNSTNYLVNDNDWIVCLNGYDFNCVGRIELNRLNEDKSILSIYCGEHCQVCLMPVDMVESIVLKSVNSLDNWGVKNNV